MTITTKIMKHDRGSFWGNGSFGVPGEGERFAVYIDGLPLFYNDGSVFCAATRHGALKNAKWWERNGELVKYEDKYVAEKGKRN